MSFAGPAMAALLMACSTDQSSITQAANMDVLIPNTLRITNAMGYIDIFIRSDGSYRSLATTGAEAAGTWTQDGSKLCLTQNDPLPPESYRRANCTEILGVKVGDSWESEAGRGRKVQMSIVGGRPSGQ
jgi:hypothetical protein